LEENKMASEKIAAMIEEIKALTVLELSELVHAVEDEFGVSAAAAVAVAAPAAGDGAAAAEEKTEFDIELTEVGAEKIKVIKAVREITGLGLAEAKAMVDGAPKVIKEAASKDDADAAKAKLEEVGAKVTLK
jgi:large subunit ribosomal protein L7/L12